MPLLGTTLPTLLDIAKRVDPAGKIDTIVETLSQSNEILMDMGWKEGNLPTGHKTTIRTGLPDVTWRLLNYGVPQTKSATAQITDTCGSLEAYAEVDKALVELNGNTAQFRASEDMAFLESMNQAMASTLFYGDTTVNPERFVGFSPRYSTTNTATAPAARNVISAGGVGGDNTSIWIVVWGDQTVMGIYPKGSKAGFQHTDLGEHTLIDANGGRFQGYRTHYRWQCGLCVKDWRYVSRVANIDYSNLQTVDDAADTSPNLTKYLAVAMGRIPNMKMGRAAIYCNRSVATYLRIKVMTKTNVHLHIGDYMGQPGTLMFMGVPIRTVDDQILLVNEAVVA